MLRFKVPTVDDDDSNNVSEENNPVEDEDDLNTTSEQKSKMQWGGWWGGWHLTRIWGIIVPASFNMKPLRIEILQITNT